jgi:hypothetical protein
MVGRLRWHSTLSNAQPICQGHSNYAPKKLCHQQARTNYSKTGKELSLNAKLLFTGKPLSHSSPEAVLNLSADKQDTYGLALNEQFTPSEYTT